MSHANISACRLHMGRKGELAPGLIEARSVALAILEQRARSGMVWLYRHHVLELGLEGAERFARKLRHAREGHRTRIDRDAVLPDFPVQMRAGRKPGGADRADQLTARDALAVAHHDPAQMAIAGGDIATRVQ